MSEPRARPDANHCFVCGPDNPQGLRVRFRLEEDVCHAEFTPGPRHGGWANLTHGGILYSLLDDVMANWLFLQGMRGHTARCEIRYRKPLPLGTRVLLSGRPEQRRGRMIVMSGEARRADDQSLVASAQGTFMVVEGGARDQPGGASKMPIS
ncbi:MAG: PaaI family thioesterase [Chromatiales bacterium]|nr:PaaI family thioesterase [Chromatiales bacterium]